MSSVFEYLLETRYLKAALGIVFLFAAGLVGFFIFSEGYNDGLEATMEKAGVGENSYFNAPLSYGDDYLHAFLSGILGFLVVLFAVRYYGWLMRGKKGE